jgi:hypothetical protein
LQEVLVAVQRRRNQGLGPEPELRAIMVAGVVLSLRVWSRPNTIAKESTEKDLMPVTCELETQVFTNSSAE